MSISINLSAVSEKVVDRYIAHYGLAVRGGINAKVSAIERHTLSSVDSDSHSAPCTECGGVSDYNLPECPYCGTVDVDDAQPGGDPPAAAGNGSAAASAEAEVEQPAARAAVAAAASDSGLNGGSNGGSPAVAAVVGEEPVKPKGKKKSQRMAKVQGSGAAPLASQASSELVHAAELDAAVGRVHAALRKGANSYWELGQALLEIFDRQLWKQRIAGGKQQFSSWNLFCRDELLMSHVNAFAIMDAARGFPREVFEELGHTKLQMLLRLPKDRRELLAEEARKGQLPLARLKEIVSDEAEGRRDTGRSGRTAKATEAAAERRAARKLPKPTGELTAVSQLGRATIKLYARPKKGSAKSSRAMSVTQDPWGEEHLVNDVVVRYTVVKAADGLKLVIERRRGEAS